MGFLGETSSFVWGDLFKCSVSAEIMLMYGFGRTINDPNGPAGKALPLEEGGGGVCMRFLTALLYNIVRASIMAK